MIWGRKDKFKLVGGKGYVSYTLRATVSQVLKGHSSGERFLGPLYMTARTMQINETDHQRLRALEIIRSKPEQQY